MTTCTYGELMKPIRFLPLVFLAACAAQPKPKVWVQDNSPAARAYFDQAFAYCEARSTGPEILGATERGIDLFDACMRAKGWRLR